MAALCSFDVYFAMLSWLRLQDAHVHPGAQTFLLAGVMEAALSRFKRELPRSPRESLTVLRSQRWVGERLAGGIRENASVLGAQSATTQAAVFETGIF